MRNRICCIGLLILSLTATRAMMAQSRGDVAAFGAMAIGASLDLQSTFACSSCREAGVVSQLTCGWKRTGCLVLLNAVEVTGVTLLGSELRRHTATRKVWWVPAAVMTVAYLYSWQHNRRVP